MVIDRVVGPLLRVPLFAGLKPLQITEIARHAERIKFKAGGTIVRAGAAGDGAYLIVSGEAERTPGTGISGMPDPVEPGSLVGELAMLVEYVYGSTVTAVGNVHCLKIVRSVLHEQMLEDPSLAQHLARCLRDRLNQTFAELHRLDEALTGRRVALPDAPAEDGGNQALQPIPNKDRAIEAA